MHLDQRRKLGRVAVVVGVFTLRHLGTGRWLHRHETRLPPLAQPLPQEGKGDAAEVTAAADATNDHVRIGARGLHLLQRLLPDDRLLDEDVVEHAAQRVLGLRVLHRQLHRLTDGDTQAAGRIRIGGKNGPPRLRIRTGTGRHLGPKGLHEHPPVGLLLVAHPHHIDPDVDSEESARHCQRAAPLPGARLRGQLRDPLGLVVVSLGHGGIGLVTTDRASALIFVVDPGRGIQHLLQPQCPA